MSGGSSTTQIQLGQTMGGYLLVEEIGRGGMSTVYRGKDANGKQLAVKVLAPHLTDSDVQRSRFYQEARIAMTLDHPGIVRALGVGEDKGRHFFAMELIAGKSLDKHLREHGRFSEPDAVEMILGVAGALEAAHGEGLIHRDIKPSNIIRTPDGKVKLVDMGLAKAAGSDLELTMADRGIGTPTFMAPEQFRDAKEATVRCDIYALAQTLYVLVTGRMPFAELGMVDSYLAKSSMKYTPPEELVPGLTQRVAMTIRRGMDAEPRKRPASARQFADLLTNKVDFDAIPFENVRPIVARRSFGADMRDLRRPASNGAPRPAKPDADAGDSSQSLIHPSDATDAGERPSTPSGRSTPAGGIALDRQVEFPTDVLAAARRRGPLTIMQEEFDSTWLLWLDRPALAAWTGLLTLAAAVCGAWWWLG